MTAGRELSCSLGFQESNFRPYIFFLRMENSGSSSLSVNNPPMEAEPIEVEADEVDLERMSKDLLRVHVCLIMEGVLTMEESKPVLHRAFSAMRRLDHDGASAMLSYDCVRLELLLARREKERSRRPLSEAAHQVARERVEGDWGLGWGSDAWRAREEMLLHRRRQEQETALAMIEGEIMALIA